MSDWKSRAKVVEAPTSDWRSRAKPLADAGSPLEQALATQTGDVVNVETPTGPAKFTRGGDRFLSPEESDQVAAAGGARLKERSLESLLSFASGGGPLGDELAGAMAMGSPPSTRPGESLLDTYRRVRDQHRREVTSATRHASPTVGISGREIPVLPLAGAVSTNLLAPNPASVLGRIGLSGAIGAEQAIGESEADLTRGDVEGFLKDTGRGARNGLLAGGGAEALSVPMRAIARGAASRVGDAVATRAATDTADVAGEVASLRGQLGGESQKMSRMFENTQRATSGGVPPAGASPINPDLQRRAMLALSDPGTARLQEKVLERSLGEMPGQVGTVTRLEEELSQRTAGAAQEASDRTSRYFAQPAFESEVAPRLGRLAYNAGTGALTGGAAGAALGAGSFLTGVGDPITAGAVGLATGLTQGLGKSAITMSRNAMAQPRLQVGALDSLINASQVAQQAARTGARSSAAATPRLEEEAAIQAFLTGG